MDKLGVSSIDDFDRQSDIFHGNKTMNRLSDTSNTNCFYDTLETNVGVGNESDDKHDTSDITDEYAVDYLHYAQKYRLNNPRNCIIGHLNINSIRNKFDAVECVLNEGLLDIFAISESKLDDSFHLSQFSVTDFSIHSVGHYKELSTQRPGSPKNTTQQHDVSVQSTLDRQPMYYSQKQKWTRRVRMQTQ